MNFTDLYSVVGVLSDQGKKAFISPRCKRGLVAEKYLILFISGHIPFEDR